MDRSRRHCCCSRDTTSSPSTMTRRGSGNCGANCKGPDSTERDVRSFRSLRSIVHCLLILRRSSRRKHPTGLKARGKKSRRLCVPTAGLPRPEPWRPNPPASNGRNSTACRSSGEWAPCPVPRNTRAIMPAVRIPSCAFHSECFGSTTRCPISNVRRNRNSWMASWCPGPRIGRPSASKTTGQSTTRCGGRSCPTSTPGVSCCRPNRVHCATGCRISGATNRSRAITTRRIRRPC